MIKFDINSFDKELRKFTRKVTKLQNSMANGFRELKLKSIDLLNEGINNAYNDYYNYQDNDTTLDQYKGDIIANEKISKHDFLLQIDIGSSSLITTKNGDLINAYYFLCFGYGYIGEFNNLVSSSIINWDYDVNNHGEEGWNYLSSDGNYKWSNGIMGYDFITPVIVYITNYGKEILWEKMKEGLK